MADYGNFQVLNIPNVLAQAQAFQNNNALMRQRFDPNSIDNRYKEAQINRMNTTPGMDTTSQIRNELFRRQMVANGATEEELARFDASVRAPWYGNIGNVPSTSQPGGYTGPLPGASLRGEGQSAGYIAGQELAGELAARAGTPPPLPVQADELDLGVQTSTPSEAELAGEKTKAQEKAKIEADRESPASQNKQATREAEAAHAVALIDEMLSLRPDGKGIRATYAYGKENVAMNKTPLLKPQEWIDAEAKRDQLISMLQLENVAKLKGTGPITEAEQQVLRQAMTVLQNPMISPQLVARELRRVKAMFTRWEMAARSAQGKESAGIPKPDFVTDAEWSNLTDEQKQQLAQ